MRVIMTINGEQGLQTCHHWTVLDISLIFLYQYAIDFHSKKTIVLHYIMDFFYPQRFLNLIIGKKNNPTSAPNKFFSQKEGSRTETGPWF